MGIWVVPRHQTRNPHRPLHRYGSPGPILPPAPNIARYSSSAVPNAGLGASADRTIDLIGTSPGRESTRARHAAQRTKGTSNKPCVSASSGANAGASVNANSLNANVVEDWGGGVTSLRARGTRSANVSTITRGMNGGGAGGSAGGGYGLSVLPDEPR